MKQILAASAALLLLATPVSAQTDKCQKLRAAYGDAVMSGKAADIVASVAALKNCPSQLTWRDYLQATNAAFELGQTSLSQKYLKQSIQEGLFDKRDFETISHYADMMRDPAFKALADQIKMPTFPEVAQLPAEIGASLVPFSQNGKWGYLYADSKQVAVKPMFDGTDFYNGASVKVLFKNNVIDIALTKKEIPKKEEVLFAPPPAMSYVVAAYEPKEPERRPNFAGFVMGSDGLVAYSSDYSHIFPFKNDALAVVMRTDSQWGVVYADGRALPGFEFNFYSLTSWQVGNTWCLFGKKDKTSDWQFFNLNGGVIFDQPAKKVIRFSDFQLNPIFKNQNYYLYIGQAAVLSQYVAIKTDKGDNLVTFDPETQKLRTVFPNYVEAIECPNGPRDGSQLMVPYVLIRDKNRFYYKNIHSGVSYIK